MDRLTISSSARFPLSCSETSPRSSLEPLGTGGQEEGEAEPRPGAERGWGRPPRAATHPRPWGRLRRSHAASSSRLQEKGGGRWGKTQHGAGGEEQGGRRPPAPPPGPCHCHQGSVHAGGTQLGARLPEGWDGFKTNPKPDLFPSVITTRARTFEKPRDQLVHDILEGFV